MLTCDIGHRDGGEVAELEAGVGGFSMESSLDRAEGWC